MISYQLILTKQNVGLKRDTLIILMMLIALLSLFAWIRQCTHFWILNVCTDRF